MPPGAGEFEDIRNHYDTKLTGLVLKRCRNWTRDRLRPVKVRRIAAMLREKGMECHLRKNTQRATFSGSFVDPFKTTVNVGRDIITRCNLGEADTNCCFTIRLVHQNLSSQENSIDSW